MATRDFVSANVEATASEVICASQIGEDVVSVYVTTPTTEQMREKFTIDQLGFAAIVIAALTDTMREK